jgi:integrase
VSRQTRGSVYPEAGGTWGIRWPEDRKRPQMGGFRTKTAAREWFDEHVAPRLRRGGPSPEITLAAFTTVYLERWDPTAHPRTRRTLREWLTPSLEQFGTFTLAELEGAAADIARWRASLPSEDRRHKATRGLRQVLAAAVCWGYLTRNPALAAGPNAEPRAEEIRPFSREEIDRIVDEVASHDAALIVFAAETGLRTNEWVATERRDIDRRDPAVAVMRRFSRNRATPYPKTQRRRVPLTPRADQALSWLPPRLDSPLLFPAAEGGHICLDNWRLRVWSPALEAASVERRGPYQLRHTFATEALAAGVSIFQLARLMGASVKTIDRHYGHLAHDSEAHLRGLLSARDRDREEGRGDARDA